MEAPAATMSHNTNTDMRNMVIRVSYMVDGSSDALLQARSRQQVPVRVVQTTMPDTVSPSLFGVLELKICLRTILESSPELNTGSIADYSVYVEDCTEPGAPMVGHGSILDILADGCSTLICGKVTTNHMAVFVGGSAESLSVRLKLRPLFSHADSFDNKNSVIPSPIPSSIQPLQSRHISVSNTFGGNSPSNFWSPFASSINSAPQLPISQHESPNNQPSPYSTYTPFTETIPEDAVPCDNSNGNMGTNKGSSINVSSNNNSTSAYATHSVPAAGPAPKEVPTVQSSANTAAKPAAEPLPSASDSSENAAASTMAKKTGKQPKKKSAKRTKSPDSNDSPSSKTSKSPESCDTDAAEPKPKKRRGQSNSKGTDANGDTAAPAKSRKSTSEKIRDKLYADIREGRVPSFCVNCGNVAPATWRFVKAMDPESNEEKEERFCNPCGLYFQTHKRMRPSRLWESEAALQGTARTMNASTYATQLATGDIVLQDTNGPMYDNTRMIVKDDSSSNKEPASSPSTLITSTERPSSPVGRRGLASFVHVEHSVGSVQLPQGLLNSKVPASVLEQTPVRRSPRLMKKAKDIMTRSVSKDAKEGEPNQSTSNASANPNEFFETAQDSSDMFDFLKTPKKMSPSAALFLTPGQYLALSSSPPDEFWQDSPRKRLVFDKSIAKGKNADSSPPTLTTSEDTLQNVTVSPNKGMNDLIWMAAAMSPSKSHDQTFSLGFDQFMSQNS
ncbi:hypothetical protein CANCADRAFT_116685 [Tortispora caseinolytica NRRL Y-17796]|uniref:GATA-type domain-containing protein n=1 Tax=Tortispora caseinolytica NRRL Y-17796 TaxID=767744 RepID=A0A1E4TH66_9ASCO|nr:hypothetical protein CANCADRAFT_116685 [Tortispora caseinolytica NRRL Y-17796]